MSYSETARAENKVWGECSPEDRARALAYLADAELNLRKRHEHGEEIPLKTAALVGAGAMGRGIAMSLANHGIPVFLKDADATSLAQGLNAIRQQYGKSVEHGRFTHEFAGQALERIQPVQSDHDLASADIVIEAVFEDIDLKRRIFGELSRICKPGSILASNTSTLNIDEIAATSRPDRVIGTHFFIPVHIVPLVEIVPGQATSQTVITTCVRLARKLGKLGIVVGNCRGFVGNRMIEAYRREAQFLVEEGADVAEVDNALTDFGMAIGPLATGDLAGLDVIYRTREAVRDREKAAGLRAQPDDRLYALKRYGQKSGAGWYRYDENRRRLSDPELTQLIHQWAAEAGIRQRSISVREIGERCIYALINEGARILEEGFARHASDIDLIYVNGYGFPRERGGPMWYADTIGLSSVYQRICELHRQHGKVWEPAPLLELAASGMKLTEFTP
jgi:3-hydroxyacyl-CoA dehydrogenase